MSDQQIAITSAFSVLLILCSLMIFGAYEYQASRPVLEYIHRISEWTKVDGYVEAEFIGKKPPNDDPDNPRKTCPRVKGSEYGSMIPAIGADPVPVKVSYPDDTTPDSSFAAGVFDIGRIRWSGVGVDRAVSVIFEIKHNCDGLIKKFTASFEL